MSKMHDENKCQAEAIQILCPEGQPWMEVCVCELYGAEWRQIITDYTKQHGRTPTPDDLIYITYQHLGQDLREAVKEAFSNV